MTATNAIGMSQTHIWSKSLIPLFVLTAISAVGLSLLALRGLNPSESTQLLWKFAFSLILVCRVRVDARSQRYSAPFDFDAFVFFAWPLVVPYYLYRTRRARGLLFGAGIWALAIVPNIAAQVIRITHVH
jgi:hypothetical protein